MESWPHLNKKAPPLDTRDGAQVKPLKPHVPCHPRERGGREAGGRKQEVRGLRNEVRGQQNKLMSHRVGKCRMLKLLTALPGAVDFLMLRSYRYLTDLSRGSKRRSEEIGQMASDRGIEKLRTTDTAHGDGGAVQRNCCLTRRHKVHKDQCVFLNFVSSWLCVRVKGISFMNDFARAASEAVAGKKVTNLCDDSIMMHGSIQETSGLVRTGLLFHCRTMH